MNNTRQPKITLVGAGPGDPDLISMAALSCLQRADVILYDALVNPILLDHAPAVCLKIYVGKRAAQHAYKQEEINQMLVDKALQFGHVVRLKGGDPYIFGRGDEELRFAQLKGIETQVIPGVSSALALADLANIPLTLQGISDNYWVITASTKCHMLSEAINQAAKLDVTTVILMGMHHLAAIITSYQSEKKGNWPIAIIQNGSLPEQQVVLGTIDTIMEQVKAQGIGAPAIIIIGRVVAWADNQHMICHPAIFLDELTKLP